MAGICRKRPKTEVGKILNVIVCTGYIIKNGERHELQRITFQYLGDACDHIQACIDEFPDITWVVYINDNDWNRVCASV